MISRLLIGLVCVALGLYIGFQLPRGAGLIATVTDFSVADNTEDYSGLASHQALLDFQSSFDSARQMVLKDARTEQEAIEGMRWLLRVASMSTHIIGDANPQLLNSGAGRYLSRADQLDAWRYGVYLKCPESI